MFLKSAVPITLQTTKEDLDVYQQFSNDFDLWIRLYSGPIGGIPKQSMITNGITDALHQLYIKYQTIGIFSGEYGYHNLVHNTTYNLEDADAIIISHPFSADGMSSHDKIALADKLNKPLIIDCAFFGACSGISFDFSQYNNVVAVMFSLSKSMGTGANRVGKIYTELNLPSKVLNINYPFLGNVLYHQQLLAKTTPNCVANKYREVQLEICREYDLVPSDTVMFGLDYTNTYDEYKRGDINRVCISHMINRSIDVTFIT